MNKKAFTLAELIGVVTLLGLISVLIVPKIIKRIKNSEGKIDEVTEMLIYSATEQYLDEKVNSYPKIDGRVYCVTLKDLIEDNKLKKTIISMKGKEIDINKYVKIEVSKKQYNYQLVDECEEIGEMP